MLGCFFLFFQQRSKELPPGADRLIVRPIYAALPKEEQLKAFAPTPVGSRKVILATNIAESSITLPGVKYVVDPGMAKQRCFRAKTGMESLVVNPISQQQAKQRAGRAGREGPGKCFRLFEEKAFLALRPAAVPEIRRCNLATVVLQLKAIGVSDVRGFDFIERPSEDALCGALAQLLSLGALASGANGAGEITPLGREMASLPLEPVYAKLVIVSARPGFRCLPSVLTLVALLSVDSIFFCPKEKREEANAAKRRFAAAEGDHLTMINAYDAWCEAAGDAEWCHSNFLSARSLRRARDVREQLVDVCRRQGMHVAPHAEAPSQDLRDRVRRCLVSACFANVARRLPRAGGGGSGGARRGGGKGGGKRQTYGRREYKSVATGQRVCIHPASVMFGRGPKAVIFGEMVLTTRPYMRCITEVDPMWLPELAPQCFRAAEVPASEPRSAGAGAPASATGPSPAPSRTSPLGSNSADDAPAPRSRAGAPTRKRRAKVEINPSILARSSAAKRCRRGRPFA
jgi:HrpA-like RNA helicase